MEKFYTRAIAGILLSAFLMTASVVPSFAAESNTSETELPYEMYVIPQTIPIGLNDIKFPIKSINEGLEDIWESITVYVINPCKRITNISIRCRDY